MASNKIYIVMKDGEELEQLKTLTAAKKLADAEGAEVYSDGKCVYQGTVAAVEEAVEAAVEEAVEETVEETAREIVEAVVEETAKETIEETAKEPEDKPDQETEIIDADPVISRKPVQPDVEDVQTEKYRLKSLMNVRKSPSLNGTVLGTKPEGTIVRVTAVKNDWLYLANGTFILYGGGKWAEKVV